jgi:adenylate kinase
VAAGTILDGFPRTAAQAEALDALMAARVSRSTPSSALRSTMRRWSQRVSGRYTCGSCGEGYHDSFKQPAKDGVCDKCGGTDMKRRADDNAETVRTRLSGLSRRYRAADRLLRRPRHPHRRPRHGRHR